MTPVWPNALTKFLLPGISLKDGRWEPGLTVDHLVDDAMARSAATALLERAFLDTRYR
jgi:hypothetical protein